MPPHVFALASLLDGARPTLRYRGRTLTLEPTGTHLRDVESGQWYVKSGLIARRCAAPAAPAHPRPAPRPAPRVRALRRQPWA